MIFDLDLRTKHQYDVAPRIESIDILHNEKLCNCDWDTAEFVAKGNELTYRFKGIYFNDVYANNSLTNDSIVKIISINFEDDVSEFEIIDFTIIDGEVTMNVK